MQALGDHPACDGDDASYSYFHEQFVGFYDTMVSECYGGTAAADVQRYSWLLGDLLQQHTRSSTASRELVVVDLGCGSGRAILAMLEHLAASHSLLHSTTTLQLLGIDNSQPMLAAAEAKCSAFLAQHPSVAALADSKRVIITWQLGSFEDWLLPSHIPAADFIVIAAAGLHHVTSTAGILQSLHRISAQLSPHGVAAVSYLPWDDLYREAEAPAGVTAEAFTVQGYRRVLLQRSVTISPDGSCVLKEKFSLCKVADDTDAPVAVTAAAAAGGGVNTSVGAKADAKQAWCIEEGWQLRRLDKPELLQLALEAGLVPSAVPQHHATSQSQGHGSHCVVFCKQQLQHQQQ